MNEVVDYLIFRDLIVPIVITFIWLLGWFAKKLEDWFRNKKK